MLDGYTSRRRIWAGGLVAAGAAGVLLVAPTFSSGQDVVAEVTGQVDAQVRQTLAPVTGELPPIPSGAGLGSGSGSGGHEGGSTSDGSSGPGTGSAHAQPPPVAVSPVPGTAVAAAAGGNLSARATLPNGDVSGGDSGCEPIAGILASLSAAIGANATAGGIDAGAAASVKAIAALAVPSSQAACGGGGAPVEEQQASPASPSDSRTRTGPASETDGTPATYTPGESASASGSDPQSGSRTTPASASDAGGNSSHGSSHDTSSDGRGGSGSLALTGSDLVRIGFAAALLLLIGLSLNDVALRMQRRATA